MEQNVYHIPALLEPCIEGLAINPSGIYVDVTFGGGGHSRAIVERLSDQGRLFGFDQDMDAWNNRIDDPRLHLYTAISHSPPISFVITV